MSRLEPQECLRTSQVRIASHNLAVLLQGWCIRIAKAGGGGGVKKKKKNKIQFEISYVVDSQTPS